MIGRILLELLGRKEVTHQIQRLLIKSGGLESLVSIVRGIHKLGFDTTVDDSGCEINFCFLKPAITVKSVDTLPIKAPFFDNTG